MTEHGERLSQPDIGQIFDESQALLELRHAELASLRSGFEAAFATAIDLDAVNEIISASDRPDLAITESVPMRQIAHPRNHGFHINNFIPGMVSFGVRVNEDGTDVTGERERGSNFYGRRRLTDDDLDLWFVAGARGTYEDYELFAEQQGVDWAQVKDMLMMTHIGKEAFVRMWLIAPDLTVGLMRRCLDEAGIGRHQEVAEEIFVAYTLMSQLVDINDQSVMRKEGLDNWLLCR